MTENSVCHSCGAGGLRPFYGARRLPVHSVLLMPSREEAVGYPKGDLRLGFCGACGFIQNTLFDPTVHEYSTRYEETQGFSPRFNAFARDLAGRLIEKYDLTGKTVLEIGCGKGEFLALMCEMGDCRGIGIDPAYVPERMEAKTAGRLTFLQEFYEERHADLEADFISCRHTLEHIQATRAFLELVRRSVGDRRETIVFFEVPDAGRVLREGAFWDIYYEHCSYFSPGSLARLFRASDFEILDLALDFADQYLLIEARPGAESDAPPPALEEFPDALERDVERFEREIGETLSGWREELAGCRARGERAILWGSGSKAVAFLTTLGLGDEIAYVVDINPYKHGKFMPGTGHAIVAPDRIREEKPDLVIIMNAIYRDEIREDLERLGAEPRLLALQ